MNNGRPKIFETAEELEKKVEEYFADRLEKGKPPLIESLALFLGFASRQSMADYEKREAFSYIIQRAKLKIFSEQMEGGLLGDYNPTLIKLNATSNHGYTDSSKTDLTSQGEKITGITISCIDADTD